MSAAQCVMSATTLLMLAKDQMGGLKVPIAPPTPIIHEKTLVS